MRWCVRLCTCPQRWGHLRQKKVRRGEWYLWSLVGWPYTLPSPIPSAVGVEHLLRDINDPSVSQLAGDIKGKFEGIKGIVSRLGDVSAYLGSVCSGELAPNNEALYELQVRVCDGRVRGGGVVMCG